MALTKANSTVIDLDELDSVLHEYTDPQIQDAADDLSNRLSDRIQASEGKLLDLEIETSYLMQRKSTASDFILDLFLNEDQTSDFETSTNKPAEVMDDSDWDNNWKNMDAHGLDFKNGFLRPQKQPYMLEIVDEYNLDGIGQAYKGAISQWDSTNECYWIMSCLTANAIGEITKLSKNMIDGRVEILARYYIPASGVAATNWAGIDSDSTTLFFTLFGADALSKIYSCPINSDGTIGKSGYEVANGETLVLADSCDSVASVQTGHYNDVIVWDSTHIMVLNCNAATVTLISILKSTLALDGTNITGLGSYIGGTTNFGKALTKYGNDLYIKMNEYTDNLRFIYKINTVNDMNTSTGAIIKTSGRWATTRDVDLDSIVEGITISTEGDILEVTSTAASGKFISRRALKNALWAENQCCGEFEMLTDGANVPASPIGCMIDPDGNYWTGESGETANTAKVYRYKTDGSVHSVTLDTAVGDGVDWTGLMDLTTDGTNVWLMGYDGTNTEIYKGTLANLILGFGSTIELDDADWVLQLNHTDTTHLRYGIAYDGNNDIIYISNTGTAKIDTLETDNSNYNEDVYDLPAPTSTWLGLAYNDGKIFISDRINSTAPDKIHVLSIDDCTNTNWYRLHIYQEPASSFVADAYNTIDFNSDKDLVCTHYTNLHFITMKTLEDPDVMQLHTFIDGFNILLDDGSPILASHTNVSCATPIVERYFEPEDFADIRDCPDKNYCGVGYGDNGFSILHLDEYLSGKSSTGKDRYDIRKIRTQHYKEGALNPVYSATSIIRAIFIEKDIIFVNSSMTCMIDLKSGKITAFYTGTTYPGLYYDGSLTERNDGKDYTGSPNGELTISHISVNKFHARTFTKDDVSDFNGENPKTFVVIGTDGGCDLLVIDWDENGNRTPVKVWNSIFANSTTAGSYALWIAPSGDLFTAEYLATGNTYQTLKKVWEINTDTMTGGNNDFIEIGSGILAGFATDIAPNSRCWKIASGEWRHLIVCGTKDISDVGDDGVHIIDVENEAKETVIINGGANNQVWNVDVFEDYICSNHSSTNMERLVFSKKFRFDDNVVTSTYNNWGRPKHGFYPNGLINGSRPNFISWVEDTAGNAKVCRYSPNHNFLAIGSSLNGLQFFHFPNIDQCIHESTEFDCDNPSAYHYIQNAILPESEKCIDIPYDDNNITYVDGASENWEETSTGGVVFKRIAKDGTTEGYFTFETSSGFVLAGIHFMRDDDSGGINVVVTETLTSTGVLTLTSIGLYYDEASVDDDYVLWITLPDPTKSYSIVIENSGGDYTGSNDYIRVRQFFLIEQLNDADASTVLRLYHTDHQAVTRDHTLVNDVSTDIVVDVTYNGDGVEDTFILSGNNYVYEPYAFSVDVGTTWMYPTSYQLTWGSNDPDYDDETVHTSTGYFGVKFDTAPESGTGNVIIRYTALYDKAKLITTLKQPSDGSTFKDLRKNIRLLDHGIELYS